MFRRSAVPNPFYHRSVIATVAEYLTSGQLGSQRLQRRVIGDEAGREDESAFFACGANLKTVLITKHLQFFFRYLVQKK